MNVHIEFCIKWNYKPDFERVSKIINRIKPKAIVTSNETYPRSGAFEITIDSALVFSKLTKNRFPIEEEIEAWLQLWNYYIIWAAKDLASW